MIFIKSIGRNELRLPLYKISDDSITK